MYAFAHIAFACEASTLACTATGEATLVPSPNFSTASSDDCAAALESIAEFCMCCKIAVLLSNGHGVALIFGHGAGAIDKPPGDPLAPAACNGATITAVGMTGTYCGAACGGAGCPTTPVVGVAGAIVAEVVATAAVVTAPASAVVVAAAVVVIAAVVVTVAAAAAAAAVVVVTAAAVVVTTAEVATIVVDVEAPDVVVPAAVVVATVDVVATALVVATAEFSDSAGHTDAAVVDGLCSSVLRLESLRLT